MTRKIVFDTSTLVSAAILPNSVPYQALQKAILFHRLYVSEEALDELGRALRREKFDRYLGLDARMTFLQKLGRDSLSRSAPAEVLAEVKGTCRDPNDDQFLALCLAIRADCLVSSDRDLLVLHPWNGIPILSPAGFLAQFQL